jgi:hypothetical protein
MLSDEEHVRATSGKGIEVAAGGMAEAMATDDGLKRVASILEAIDALSLHLGYVEASAELFTRRYLARLPEASPDDLQRFLPREPLEP